MGKKAYRRSTHVLKQFAYVPTDPQGTAYTRVNVVENGDVRAHVSE